MWGPFFLIILHEAFLVSRFQKLLQRRLYHYRLWLSLNLSLHFFFRIFNLFLLTLNHPPRITPSLYTIMIKSRPISHQPRAPIHPTNPHIMILIKELLQPMLPLSRILLVNPLRLSDGAACSFNQVFWKFHDIIVGKLFVVGGVALVFWVFAVHWMRINLVEL